MKNEEITYRPSAFYFRRALREARTKKDAVEIGLTVVAELENLKQWIRDHGEIPPKRHLMLCEADEKGWTVL